jgi:uncharacterized membrane protein YqjE
MSNSVPPPDAGLASTAVTVVGSVLKLAGVRFSMAIMEFSDARDAFLRVLLLIAIALISSTLALLSISAMVVMLTWDALGWHILLILFIVYLMLAISVLAIARNIIASGKIGFPVTKAELRKDREVLFNDRGETDRRP